MTLTCDQSDPVIGGGASKRKMSSTENSKLDSKISRTDFSASETEKVKLHPSQIDAEFRVLQSLIPQIANKQQLSELEIIDACVTYIEKLQSQLLVKPDFEEDDEGIEEGDLEQQQHEQQHDQQQEQQQRRRLEGDCNGNLEK